MTAQLRAAWHLLRPPPGDPHGPLAPMLVVLTVVTGIVDGYSYLTLGHVFVANMTGNVVFLGFGLAGVTDFTISASVTALLAFSAGAVVGGRFVARLPHRGRLVWRAVAVETALVAATLVVALPGAAVPHAWRVLVLVVLLSAALGLQNATARALAVPDLTTTVLTLTITGISADGRAGSGGDSRLGRRALAVLAMFAGAFAGGTLVLHADPRWAPALALVLLAADAAAAWRVRASDAPWTHRPGA